MEKKIWLSSPHLSGYELQYIVDAIQTNWVAPLGPNVDEFEQVLAQYLQVQDAAVLSSGTAAIHLALIILGVKPGDEIIASTLTFSATINPIIYQCAHPILVDSEPQSWNMSPDWLETAIKARLKRGKKPKAIIPVHVYGMPCKMQEIMDIANYYQIPVVEDAAEALGSRYDGKALGSIGQMGVLSFNGNKIITTSGGGALLSNNRKSTAKARFLSTQARDPAPHYQHSVIGYNYRMSNVTAGIGLGQMEVIDQRIIQRRKNQQFYRELFANIPGISFQEEPDDRFFSNYWLTAITVDDRHTGGITCEMLRKAFEQENIESRPLWKPMHLQPVFRKYPFYGNGTSERLFRKGQCLPSGSNLTDDDRLRIAGVVNRLFNRREIQRAAMPSRDSESIR
jgi:dTDP-4-amino-4,6-dideoxygalactose transaminase